jgi:two-component system LytT family sensor kinase
MRTRYWATVTVFGFAVYTVFAVLGTISTLIYWTGTGHVTDVPSFVANRVLDAYTTALFVPPFFWLVERFPLMGPLRRRNSTMFVVIVLCSVVIKYAVMLPLFRVWTGHWGSPFWLTVLDDIVPASFGFAAIIGVALALQYYRDIGERERTAAALQTQLVQARLDVLRGQLHPHFIFNSLNAAATLMHDDVDAADHMLTQLADLLRISLERAQAEIALSEELELVERYLSIMRYRFADRLSVVYSVDDNARVALVPTFFLQPLVENAIEHGIARRPGPGQIVITARRPDDSTLELAVADDGPGFVDEPQSGIGLSNTRERLRQLYGSAGSLVLETAAGGGASVVVRMPFRECATS